VEEEGTSDRLIRVYTVPKTGMLFVLHNSQNDFMGTL